VSKIRKALVGGALAASLAGALAATPAMAAAAPAQAAPALSAQAPRHFFGPIYSRFSNGEDFGHRSYFKGYWNKDHGRYWFTGDLYDRDGDHQYSYVWYRWHDNGGTHVSYYKTFGHRHFDRWGGFRKSSGFNDFDIRVCEGGNRFADCGGWQDVF